MYLLLALCALLLAGCHDGGAPPDLSVEPSSVRAGDTVMVYWDAHGKAILADNFGPTGNSGAVPFLVPDTGGQNDPSSYTLYLRTAGGTAYARIEVSP